MTARTTTNITIIITTLVLAIVNVFEIRVILIGAVRGGRRRVLNRGDIHFDVIKNPFALGRGFTVLRCTYV